MFFNADQAEGAIAKAVKPAAPSNSGHPALSPKQFGKPGGAPGGSAEAAGAGDAAAAGGAEAAAGASGLAELAPLALLA